MIQQEDKKQATNPNGLDDLPDVPANKVKIRRLQTSNFKQTRDISTLSNHLQIKTLTYHLDWFIDFSLSQIRGSITHIFEVVSDRAVQVVDLDTHFLKIEKVWAIDSNEEEKKETSLTLKFQFIDDAKNQSLGKCLRIHLTDCYEKGSKLKIRIDYSTTRRTQALSWLKPQMTHEKTHPFMFSQCQMIFARSLAPLQDTPWNKSNYTARVQCPKDLCVYMSAVLQEDKSDTQKGIYYFEQNIMKIPSYLLAIVCGNMKRIKLDERCGVISQPSFVERSARQLEDIPAFLKAAQQYVDIQYNLPQYNIVILPPAFPFGGMENPIITFGTPTLIVGDKSQSNVAAHQIAHSWTGNLITNRTWQDFWLNQGFTVFIQRKIIASVYGEEEAKNHAFVGQRSLNQHIEGLMAKDKVKDTSLRFPLVQGENPDDYFSILPYEKGFLFLSYIESKVGEKQFQEFMQGYLEEYKDKTVSQDDFKRELEDKFGLDFVDKIQFDKWTTGVGETIINGEEMFRTKKMEEIITMNKKDATNQKILKQLDQTASSTVKIAYIQHVNQLFQKGELKEKDIKKIDQIFKICAGNSCEMKLNFFPIALKSEEKKYFYKVVQEVKKFLASNGRGKYVYPIFTALSNQLPDQTWEFYLKIKKRYHPIVANRLMSIINRPKQINPTKRQHQIGGSKISIVHGDICKEYSDCIVNAANDQLAHGAGVAGAITSKGGPDIERESSEYIQQYKSVPTGTACYTGAGLLPCCYVIHAVGPIFHKFSSKQSELLASSVKQSLKIAEELKAKIISIPAISSGIFGFPKPYCAYIMLDTAANYLNDNKNTSIQEIRLTNFDQPTVRIFEDAFDQCFGSRYGNVNQFSSNKGRGFWW